MMVVKTALTNMGTTTVVRRSKMIKFEKRVKSLVKKIRYPPRVTMSILTRMESLTKST